MAEMKSGKIAMPEGASHIIRVLEQSGYEGYVVGGCVRDALLGRNAHDWDITTSARPEQVKALFRRTVDTGIAHGTVTVLTDGGAFEVTTYRIDGEYVDSRHPSSVTFTPSLREDLKRRDFTINAMAYNEKAGLVDLFDGTGDLARGVVRCVGEPSERFSEDALRIMRAVRFAAQLGFELDPDTMRSAGELAPTLRKISAERIRDELMKLITSDRPGMLDTARRIGITGQVLPEFDALIALPCGAGGNAGTHTLQAMENARGDDPKERALLRLTMLLHDIGKAETEQSGADGEVKYPGHAARSAQMAQTVMRRLKMDNETIRMVTTLVRFHTFLPEAEAACVRRAVNEIGTGAFPLWLQVKEADIKAQSGAGRASRLDRLEQVKALYAQILADRDPVQIKDLALSGRDLIADGMKPGRELGEVLERLLDEVLENPSLNRRQVLLERSRALRGTCGGRISGV